VVLVITAGLCWHFSQPRKLVVTKILSDVGEILCTRGTGIYTVKQEVDPASHQSVNYVRCFDWSGQQRWSFACPVNDAVNVRNTICISPDGHRAAMAIPTRQGFRILRWYDDRPEKSVDITCNLIKSNDADLAVNIKDDSELLIACGPASKTTTEFFFIINDKVIARGRTQGHKNASPSGKDYTVWYERNLSADGKALLLTLQINGEGVPDQASSPEYISLQMKGNKVRAIHKYCLDLAPDESDLLADGTLVYSDGYYNGQGKVANRNDFRSVACSPDGKCRAELYRRKLVVFRSAKGKAVIIWQKSVQASVPFEVDARSDGQYAATAFEQDRPLLNSLAIKLNYPDWLPVPESRGYRYILLTIFQRPGRVYALRSLREKIGHFDPVTGLSDPDLLHIDGHDFSPSMGLSISPDGKHLVLPVCQGRNWEEPSFIFLEAK